MKGTTLQGMQVSQELESKWQFETCHYKKLPSSPAKIKINLNLAVINERVKGRPFSKKNRGPGRLPRLVRQEATEGGQF